MPRNSQRAEETIKKNLKLCKEVENMKGLLGRIVKIRRINGLEVLTCPATALLDLGH